MAVIPLTKAHQFWPLTDYLRSAGVPLNAHIERSHLPVKMLDAPDLYVDESRFWELCSRVAQREGLLDWGFQAGSSIQLADLGDFGTRLMKQCTLKASLETFIDTIREETLFCNFALMRQDERFWLTMQQKFSGGRDVAEGLSIMELYNLQFLLKLVRTAVGMDWLPPAIHLQCDTLPDGFDASQITSGTIRFSSTMTAIAIPAELLSSPMESYHSSIDISYRSDETVDFPSALRLLLQGYLDEALTIQQAAELVGTSGRTLQRRLSEHGTSFNELLDQTRFDVAKQLLLDDSIPILDVCYEVGYNDPGNFSRAFRRWSGVSPRHHRKLHCAEAHL